VPELRVNVRGMRRRLDVTFLLRGVLLSPLLGTFRRHMRTK